MKGYILNDQVRCDQCEDCQSVCEVLTVNFGNPNLFLNDCKNSKCKNRLLRLDFAEGNVFKVGAYVVDEKSIA